MMTFDPLETTLIHLTSKIHSGTSGYGPGKLIFPHRDCKLQNVLQKPTFLSCGN